MDPGVADAHVVPSGVAPLLRALQRHADPEEEAWRVAATYAQDGESLQTLLDDLDRGCAALGEVDAAPHVMRSVAVAWSETFLSELGRIGCTDELTGLASRHHLQTRLRDPVNSGTTTPRALLVVELRRDPRQEEHPGAHALMQSMGLVDAAVAVRRVVGPTEPPARLTARRCALLVDRGLLVTDLPTRVEREVEQHLRRRETGMTAHVWAEGLPADPDQAAAVVDELCR